LLLAAPAQSQGVGPSTSTAPYLVPNPGLGTAVGITSVLTVGDEIGGYRMVGIPDGLGAWADDDRDEADDPGRDEEDRGDDVFNLVMNHELGAGAGAARSHGSAGSFVSRWTLDPETLAVRAGRDHATSPGDVFLYDRATGTWSAGTTAWERFCSADLARPSAFRHRGLGTSRRIFLTGEETRPPFTTDHGRAFAHVVTGEGRNESWELPALGRMSFENVVASPHAQRKTVVIGLDDADVRTDPAATPAPSELYVYVGTKKRTGNTIERAGLTGGHLHGVQVVADDGGVVSAESNPFALGAASFVGSAAFRLVDLGDVSSRTGNELQAASISAGVTRFQRIEDGAWDPRPGHQDDFYFVTTATSSTNSRLWRLRFADVEHPELGGSLEAVLVGTEGHRMLDNITIDPVGRLVMVEDVGNNARLGKVWLYDLGTKNLVEVAAADPARFLAGAPGFLTQDEEASGVIPAFDLIGPGWYLLTVQAHYGIAGELVEGGQLLALWIDPELGR
jgi:hypothetical protein